MTSKFNDLNLNQLNKEIEFRRKLILNGKLIGWIYMMFPGVVEDELTELYKIKERLENDR